MILGRGGQASLQLEAEAKATGPEPSKITIGMATTTSDSQPGSSFLPKDGERVSVTELRTLQESGAPIVILDVRTERSYEASGLEAGGAVRVNPDRAAIEVAALNLPRNAWLIAFCA
jgi:hypothetical protein